MKALNSLTTGGTAIERPLDIIVRASTEDDVPAMLAIYAHHIQRGLGEMDVEPLNGEDIKRRRKNMLKHRLPHLVAEHHGMVIGYAYAVPFRKRPAYRYTVKHSIYVHHAQVGQGIGRILLQELIDVCAASGFRQIIGYIDADNAASLALHARFGFARVGLLPGVAYRHGRWADTIMVQRSLASGSTTAP